MNKTLLTLSLAGFFLLPQLAGAVPSRDPFMPVLKKGAKPVVETTSDGAAAPDLASSPLMNESVSTLKVVGVFSTPETAVAVIRTSEQRDYIINSGQMLGSERATVKSIDAEGITLLMGENSVFRAVSNKVEVQAKPAGEKNEKK